MTSILPRLRGSGGHRAVDEVERLRRNEIILLTNLHAAGDEVALLRQDMNAAQARQAEAELLVVQQQADIDDLTAERNQLAEELAALKQRFAAELADEANTNSVIVPCGYRDTTAVEDQATGPIDVRALWEAADAGLLGPVTDPGHITH